MKPMIHNKVKIVFIALYYMYSNDPQTTQSMSPIGVNQYWSAFFMGHSSLQHNRCVPLTLSHRSNAMGDCSD
ncbi:hypothetical protein BLOT_013120 [Blomia tropicalis]|nr:hypothetical protein BLOT_013120 [Blomia tropicalis]